MSPMLVIFITVFIDLLGFGFVLPLGPYYTEHFGGTATAVGLLAASYSLMQFIFAPFWGRVSDRVGRRPILLMSLLGSSVSFIIYSTASSLVTLFVARILQGIFTANISAAQAYVADISTKENRSKSMGLIGAAFGLGFIFGPAIGAKLSEYGPAVGTLFGHHPDGIFGMGFPAFVAGLLCLVNFVMAYFILPESLKPEFRNRHQEKTSRFFPMLSALKNSKINWLILIFFLATFSMANMETTIALFAEKRLNYGIRQTGMLFAFTGIIIAFTQGYLIRKLLPKLGEKKLLIVGPLMAGLALAAVIFVKSDWEIKLAMALLAIGSGMSNPAVLGVLSNLTDEREQGRVMGINQSFSSLARILGPTCGGLLFSKISPAAPYVVAAAVMILSAILALKNSGKVPATIRRGDPEI